jgi:mono/diheme cytochrome c family protein
MERAVRRLWAVLLVAAAAGVFAVAGWSVWRARGVGPVQRGFAVAAASGCFGCHGASGLQGFEDRVGGIGDVPPFSHDALETYVKSEAEIREWILDGAPRRLREEPEPPDEKPNLLRMPAWRGVLSAQQVDDLVAYVKAVSDYDLPNDPEVEAGRQAAMRLACFGCHGPQGRGSLPNPGSFRGCIPAWDGPDFAELAANEDEVREWILDGSPRRLREHPVARVFLRREAVQMPAYRGRLIEGELESLLAYIRWLRGPATAPPRQPSP